MAEGYNKRQTRRANDLIALAWNTAALSRAKEIPKLESLLISDNERRQNQTDDEMLEIVKLLNAAFGGEVVEVGN